MKKKLMQSLAILLAGLMILPGCASIGKGTNRPAGADSEVPNTMVSLDGGPWLPITTVFNIKTTQKGPFVFRGRTPDGRIEEQVLHWENKDGMYWLVGGGVAWGIVGGVAGLVSMGVDYGTKAYRDLDHSTVHFKFTLQSSVATNQQLYPANTLNVLPPAPEKQWSSRWPAVTPGGGNSSSACDGNSWPPATSNP